MPASWDEALDRVAGKLQMSKGQVAGVAGGRLSNEDLFMFQRLLRDGLGSNDIDVANPQLAGGDVVAQVGLSRGQQSGRFGDRAMPSWSWPPICTSRRRSGGCA